MSANFSISSGMHRSAQFSRTLRAGLHGCGRALLRCNSFEWNHHSASLRLALHAHNRTLQPVQLRIPG